MDNESTIFLLICQKKKNKQSFAVKQRTNNRCHIVGVIRVPIAMSKLDMLFSVNNHYEC